MGWNYLSTHELQKCSRWSLGMDKWSHPTLYWVCDYLSMLGYMCHLTSGREQQSCSIKLWYFKWHQAICHHFCNQDHLSDETDTMVCIITYRVTNRYICHVWHCTQHLIGHVTPAAIPGAVIRVPYFKSCHCRSFVGSVLVALPLRAQLTPQY